MTVQQGQEREFPLIPQNEWGPTRQSIGLPASKVAELLKFDAGSIRRWEQGAGSTDSRKIYEYALAFSKLVHEMRQAKSDEIAARHPATNAQLAATRGFRAGMHHYTSSGMEGATADELRSLAAELNLLARQASQAAMLIVGKAASQR